MPFPEILHKSAIGTLDGEMAKVYIQAINEDTSNVSEASRDAKRRRLKEYFETHTISEWQKTG